MSVGQKRPGAPYHYDFKVGGHRFYSTTTATNRRDAELIEKAARDEAKRELAEARANGSRVSLQIGHVALAYWEQIGQHHAGAEDTNRLLNLLIKHFGPTTLLTAVTDAEVAAMVAWRRGHTVPHTKRLISPATVNDTTEVLKKLFTFTKRQKAWGARLDHEPDWPLHWIKGEKQRIRELTHEETATLTEGVRDDYRPLFEFLLATGVRKTEARLLRWSNVHWDTRQIRTAGKGGADVVVSITPAVHAILWPMQGLHEVFVFTMVAERTRDGRVEGQRYPISHSGLNTRWRRDRKKAGLADLHIHDLRHDFASKLQRECGDITIVREALNHKSVRTTERYAHVRRDTVTAAIERMEQSRRQIGDKTAEKVTPKVTPGFKKNPPT